MRILGLDPGLRLTGYGCIEIADVGEPDGVWGGECRLVEGGVFRLGGRATRGGRRGTTGEEKSSADRSAASVSARLVELERDLTDAIERLKPGGGGGRVAVCALQAPGDGDRDGARAGGAAAGDPAGGVAGCVEFKPNEVKKSLTGHGHASKAQMQIGRCSGEFGLAEPPSPPDVADAIAIALCAATRRGSVGAVPPRARSRKAAEKALLARAVV
jgi:crossover junction endodeoxyribonuclease RuvC